MHKMLASEKNVLAAHELCRGRELSTHIELALCSTIKWLLTVDILLENLILIQVVSNFTESVSSLLC
jgi:hypothetical protein